LAGGVRKDSDTLSGGFRTDSCPVHDSFSFAENPVKNLSKQTGWTLSKVTGGARRVPVRDDIQRVATRADAEA
jgi:hypothetical protein